MHNFRQLTIWKDAMKLAKTVYTLTGNFPSQEKYGLTSQINRAVISVASNIAEVRHAVQIRTSGIFFLLQ